MIEVMPQINMNTQLNFDTHTNRQAAERLQTLYAVQDMLRQVEAEGLNIKTILPQVLEIAARQLESPEGSIIVVNQHLEIEYIATTTGPPSDNFIDNIMSHGLAGWVIRAHQPYIIHDTRTDEHWLPRPGHMTTLEPWSVICTPFTIRHRAVGAITIHKAGARQFNEHDLNLLMAISNQAASTIENARLFSQTQRKLQESALLYEASKVINSSLDINEIMRRLVEQTNELFHAEAISIALVDRHGTELIFRVAEGLGKDQIVGLHLPINQGISGWVVHHREAVLTNDTSHDARFHLSGDQRTGHPTRAMICAPLESKNRVLGTIQAINPIEGKFTTDDLELLVKLANIASSAIANAQQFAQTQAAEARYMSLFQDSIDPIILTDLSGTIVEANRHAFGFFRYDREALLIRTIYDLHPPEANLYPATAVAPDEVFGCRSRALTKEGRSIPVEVYVKRTSFGDSDYLQWIHHDISQQVELERMREDLTAMLFHDLQSPLGNVISSLELMKYEVTDPLVLSMLDIASRSSMRLQSLVRSLLDVNQLEAGHPIRSLGEVEIDSLFEYAWDMEQPNLERRGIAYLRQIEPGLPQVCIDEDMVRRVLVNLVDNAIKHSQESQHVLVSASQVQLPPGKMVLVSVSDQGIGIPPEYRTKIFEKFERIKTKSNSKGLGLGLAFCRLAIEAHGGTIWVDDAPGGGARFNFTLPTNREQVPSS